MLKINRCINCNKIIDKRAKKCIECFNVSRRGYKHTLKTRKKMRESLKKYYCLDKNAHKGKNNPNFGNRYAKKHYCILCGQEVSDYRVKKCRKCYNIYQSKILKGRKRPEHSKMMSGSKNPAFINGLSKLPYSLAFNNTLKSSIRKRDNHKCQICQKTEEKELHNAHKVLSVHHIDYNKANCEENNLISLCNKCNKIANANRDYWFAYFTYIMETK